MKKNSLSQRGASLIESLIALAILLFIMFIIFVLFGSIMSKGYTLNENVDNSRELNNALEEYKRTGILDADNYDVVSVDNGDGTYNQHLCVKGSSNCSDKQDSSAESAIVVSGSATNVNMYVSLNNGSWKEYSSTINVNYGDNLYFGPKIMDAGQTDSESSGENSRWNWSGCFTASGRQKSLIASSSCVAKATYTLSDGSEASASLSVIVDGDEITSEGVTGIDMYIEKDGEWNIYPSIINVNKGQYLYFGPRAKSGSEDDWDATWGYVGDWSWSGCFSVNNAREHGFTAEQSCIAKVTYASEGGDKTFQNVSVIVDDDDVAGEKLAIVPYVRVNSDSSDDWKEKSSISIKPGDTVDFAPHANLDGDRIDAGGTVGSWTWSGCFSATGQYVEDKTFASSCTETATYTYTDGTIATQNFSINVYTAADGGSGNQGEDGGRTPFVTDKPIAILNKVNCTSQVGSKTRECTFNAVGSSVANGAAGKYTYFVEAGEGAKDNEWEYSVDGGAFDTSSPTLDSQNDTVTIKFKDYGNYNVYVEVSDFFGFGVVSDPVDVLVAWPPVAVLSVESCYKAKCVYSAKNSTVHAESADYKYTFSDYTPSELSNTNKYWEPNIIYTGKDGPNDTGGLSYGENTVEASLEIVDSSGGVSTGTATATVDIPSIAISVSNKRYVINNSGGYDMYGDITLTFPTTYGVGGNSMSYHVDVFNLQDNTASPSADPFYPSVPDWGNVNYQRNIDSGLWGVYANTPVTITNQLLYTNIPNKEGRYGFCVSGKGFSMNCAYSDVTFDPPSFKLNYRANYNISGYSWWGIDITGFNVGIGDITHYKMTVAEDGTTKTIFNKSGNILHDTGVVSKYGTIAALKPVKTFPDSWGANPREFCLELENSMGKKATKCMTIGNPGNNLIPWIGLDVGSNKKVAYNGGYNLYVDVPYPVRLGSSQKMPKIEWHFYKNGQRYVAGTATSSGNNGWDGRPYPSTYDDTTGNSTFGHNFWFSGSSNDRIKFCVDIYVNSSYNHYWNCTPEMKIGDIPTG